MVKRASREKTVDSASSSSISDAYRFIQRSEASWRGRHISKETGPSKASETFQETFKNEIEAWFRNLDYRILIPKS